MEKAKKIIYGQNGNISKEGESIKRNQKEILKLKSIKELLASASEFHN